MRDIFLIDDMHPEDIAMLQALYSRSPQSVVNHLEKVKKVGSGRFMSQFYVGYGHSSIGDCGNTTLFIENVSMLAAKAIQDSPLYNGQEASTRYLDMSKQPVLNPLGNSDGKYIQDTWMEFYTSSMDRMVEHCRARFPQEEGVSDKQYEKAIKARAFDVMRGFLPAGCTTMVSWTTNLRHAADHLANLRHYPISEVRELSEEILGHLKERYQHSFNHKRYPETEAYLEIAGSSHLFDPKVSRGKVLCTPHLQSWALQEFDTPLFAERPPRCRLPHYVDVLGHIEYEFLLDFGSFRDLQRHRNGVCRMPLLSTKWGFNEWYLDQLPEDLRSQAVDLLGEQELEIATLGDPIDTQHYVAMGYNVPCWVSRGLPGTLYLIELRSSKTVHPTMRKVAQDMATTLRHHYPNLVIHADMDPNDWDVKRGSQDIEAK